jgi:hypothetical protein
VCLQTPCELHVCTSKRSVGLFCTIFLLKPFECALKQLKNLRRPEKYI